MGPRSPVPHVRPARARGCIRPESHGHSLSHPLERVTWARADFDFDGARCDHRPAPRRRRRFLTPFGSVPEPSAAPRVAGREARFARRKRRAVIRARADRQFFRTRVGIALATIMAIVLLTAVVASLRP